MQRHQIVEIIQPMQGQVGRFPSAPMRSGRGEQDGNDVVVTGDADHAAEVGAEVGQGDAIRAGLPEEPHQGKHGPVGELDDPQIRRLPEEARRVLVLETDALPMVVPSEVHGDRLRLHGQDVPLQLLQAGPGAPAFDADGHEREDGVRIARLDDRSQFAGVASALAARVAHEDYRRTPICSGGHSVGVSVWNPEQIGVDKKPRSKMDRSGIAELDPGRRQDELRTEEAQPNLDRDQQNHRDQDVVADQPRGTVDSRAGHSTCARRLKWPRHGTSAQDVAGGNMRPRL